ncbi:uncharacterized protein [Palaemon carinicauda]|uniref:uncharacterized protein n=1 Tax=Palaemon carinicauda TaxID=392227 RepID=UPI0035B59D29
MSFTFVLSSVGDTLLVMMSLLASSSRHCVASSAEFLERIKDVRGEGVITSIYVESLFTNVPVDETIDLIADRVYRDEATLELNIPEQALRTLLAICTKRTPFTTHRGHVYLQKNAVAMVSSLGVLFANFYMGVVEERVFSQLECPLAYFRYIDDTFVKATSTQAFENLRRTFEDNSILHFTLENSVDNRSDSARQGSDSTRDRSDSASQGSDNPTNGSRDIKLYYKGLIHA